MANGISMSQRFRAIGAQLIDLATKKNSDSGENISAGEIDAIISTLDADETGITTNDIKLLKSLRDVPMDADARTKLYQVAGVLPAPEDPTLPPIVALYAAFINDAIRNETDVARLKAIASGAEVALQPFGGTSPTTRPFGIATTTGASPAAAANVPNGMAHIRECQTAFAALQTRIAELEAQ